jgi:exodeoxyribonuclease V alpha subunit
MVQTITLTVQRVRFHSNETGFTVATGVDEVSGEELTVVGNFPRVEIGEVVSVTGEWRDDSKWGRQFVAASVAQVVPTSAEGIQAYLTAGHVKGIGEALAERLVKKFGADLLRVIDEEPQRLMGIPGVGKRTLKKIETSWQEQRGVRDVMIFLASLGLGGARAVRIYKQYADNAVGFIRENPYRLASDIKGIGFDTADSIAKGLGYDRESPFRLLAGLQHVIDSIRQSGHCGLSVDHAVKEMAKLLGVPSALGTNAVAMAIESRIVVEEQLDGRRMLFDPSLYRCESRIASALAKRADERPNWKNIDAESAVKIAESESGIALDATQRRAVDLALTSKAVVITGGPGVGKTTLVRALLAVFQSAELKVSLAAPTGRAAKRLGESTGSSAQTIHRLLETSPDTGDFQRNEQNPLEADVVIVDEASMIDVPIMDALLRAMAPHAAIVIVGDADQLPSIGPGQVLHDILESGRVPSIRLTEIHRQAAGSEIILNAHRINRGELPNFGMQNEKSDMFLFASKSPEKAIEHVIDLVTSKISRNFGFDSKNIQVLAPMRKGPVGVNALNAVLQSVLNPAGRHHTKVERPHGIFFYPADKVMQTENNYNKRVFNGDVGVIATIQPEKMLFTVDFGADLIVDYTYSEADQLTLAYATTIHKAQGSEYEAVVVVLMPQHQIMLRRNLLYTAVTRGRKLIVVVGDQTSVATAVRTGHGGERFTRLKHCLVAANAADP